MNNIQCMIRYSFYPSIFGDVLIADDATYLCWISFADDKDSSLQELQNKYRSSELIQESSELQKIVLDCISNKWENIFNIPIHLHGTQFQQDVWAELQKIPLGQTKTYKQIAEAIGRPKAVRAVWSAIGANPIAIIIPCHRVVSSDGSLGGYHWGIEKKITMIKWEISQVKWNSK